VEGCELFVLTDHKPLTFAPTTHSQKLSLRQARHLHLILQFTVDIRHVIGGANVVADALSQAAVNSFRMPQPTSINFEALAKAQKDDTELTNNSVNIRSRTSSLLTCDAYM
jgi:hypothetical protein